MTEVQLVRIKIREGQRQKWLDWCEESKRRGDEVLETLKSEGVISESCFLSEDENAVYYFMEAKDFKKAYEAYGRSTFPIDRENKAIHEAALDHDTAVEFKVLFSFRAPEK